MFYLVCMHVYCLMCISDAIHFKVFVLYWSITNLRYFTFSLLQVQVQKE